MSTVVMNINVVAAVIESLYYAGRPKSGGKMDRADFAQLAKMALGSVMRKLYYAERQSQGEIWIFADQLKPKVFEVGKKDAKGRRDVSIINKDDKEKVEGVFRLPRGLGIFEITPVGDCPCPLIARAEPGSEWLYSGKEYEGQPRWVLLGKMIRIYELPDCITEIEVVALWNIDDLEIPLDVAFDVVNEVFATSIKTVGFPIDKTNNADPNLQEIKHRLAEAQTI